MSTEKATYRKTFANVYQNLYNSVDDIDETSKLLGQVNELIGDLSVNDVNMVTSDIVRKTTKQIKPNKNDPVFAFNSDRLKRAPRCYFITWPTFSKAF